MSRSVDAELTWAVAELPRALWVLIRAAGAASAEAIERPPRDSADVEGWLTRASAGSGIEIEPVTAAGDNVERFLRGGAPALVAVEVESGEVRYLVLVGGGRRSARILAPDGRSRRVAVSRLRDLVLARTTDGLRDEIETIAENLELAGRPRARVIGALFEERLAGASVDGWLLRPEAASFRRALSEDRVPSRVVKLLTLYLIGMGLFIASWWTIGKAALEGHLDRGYLWAWVLLLLTLIPLRLLATWYAGRISVDLGRILRDRMLRGAINIDGGELRHQGVGHLLGRVMESDAVETLALNGGVLALFAASELALIAAVLAAGAGGLVHVALLVAWLVFTGVLVLRYYGALREWTTIRLGLTHDLVERMVGHRTRLVQEPLERWHEGEDEELAVYAEESVRLDRRGDVLTALIPRGWLVLAVIGLLPSFASAATAPAALAVSLGGALLGYRALGRLVNGLADVARAAVAWKQISRIFQAADEVAPTPPAVEGAAGAGPGSLLLEARHLSYRYRDRGRPVLEDVDLLVRRGDRLLLEGPSGSGKSTLATILAGLRVPDSGLLLLDGLDRRTLGLEGFRRSVVVAPQFHENHVFGTTFVFNLLMGRGWPPTRADFFEAWALCEELGLRELLERMPSGLLQQVGDTGWQLSHGERSRLFIARALLQRPDLLILDESFAALDPETLHRTMQCVLDRAETVLVIAHP